MTQLPHIALAGLGAHLVDGSLGMGYGVTSASLPLATGMPSMVARAVVLSGSLLLVAAVALRLLVRARRVERPERPRAAVGALSS